MNGIKYIIAIHLSLITVLSTSTGVLAYLDKVEPLKPAISGSSGVGWAVGLTGSIPTLAGYLLAVFLFAAFAIVLWKTLNPMAEDREAKFKEGKSYFQRFVILLVLPALLFLGLTVLYAYLQVNPWFTERDPEKMCIASGVTLNGIGFPGVWDAATNTCTLPEPPAPTGP